MLVFNEARLFVERADKLKEDAAKQVEKCFRIYQRGLITLSEFSKQVATIESETEGKLKELNRDMIGTLSYLSENGYCNLFEG